MAGPGGRFHFGFRFARAPPKGHRPTARPPGPDSGPANGGRGRDLHRATAGQVRGGRHSAGGWFGWPKIGADSVTFPPDDSTASTRRAAWTAARFLWRAGPRPGFSAGRHRAGVSVRAPGRWFPFPARDTAPGFSHKPERVPSLRAPDDSTASEKRARLDRRTFLVPGRAGGLVFPPADTGRGVSVRAPGRWRFLPVSGTAPGFSNQAPRPTIPSPVHAQAPGFFQRRSRRGFFGAWRSLVFRRGRRPSRREKRNRAGSSPRARMTIPVPIHETGRGFSPAA
jgi:hypothetical protein